MRALVQRVDWAQVEVAGKTIGQIGRGLLVYVGVGVNDRPEAATWLADNVANLRIFEDEQGKLNVAVQNAPGGVLAVSNFTLLADARKGRRPSFIAAAAAESAQPLHEQFVQALRQHGLDVQTGEFGADMKILSQAAGPVNVIIDSPELREIGLDSSG